MGVLDDLRRIGLPASLSGPSPVGHYEVDLVTGKVYWSPEMRVIVGVSLDAPTVAPAGVPGFVHPEDRDRVGEALSASFDPAGEGVFDDEHRILLCDGTMRWVHLQGSTTFEGEGPARRAVKAQGVITDITARKQAEARLVLQFAELEHLYDHAPVGLCMVDRDLRFVRINARLAQINGVPPEEHLGRSVEEIVPSLAAQVREVTQRILATGQPVVDHEFTGETDALPGDLRTWNESWYPIVDEHARVAAFGVVVEDITERKRADERLRRSEESFRHLADAMPHLVWIADEAGQVLYYNKQATRFAGIRQTKTGTWEWQPVVHQEDLAKTLAAWQEAVGTGKPYECEHRIFMADGESRWHLSRAYRAEVGESGVRYGTATDIHDLKLAQEIAKASEERLSLALSAARAGAWTWDPSTGRTEWSDEVYHLYGVPRGDHADTLDSWRTRVFPGDLERVTSEAMEAWESGNEYWGEFRILHPELGVRWLLTLGRVEKDAQGRPRRMHGINIDITERKHQEEALREADRRKDEFLASLAHELRNPLAPLRTGLEILSLGPAPAQADAALESMHRQLGYLVNLVDDLLDVSRLRAGKIDLRQERVDLRHSVESAVEACDALIRAKQHKVELQFGDTPLWVRGDATRVVQILTNLVNNAAKYTEPRGHIRVVLEVDRPQALVHVCDNGAGIEPEMLPALWDMFYQVRDTLEKAQGGLGIGLTLCKRLAELHGGSVEAHSEGKGMGSRFTLRLPLSEEVHVLAGPRESTAAAGQARKVIVVDDNPDIAKVMAMLLRLKGHEVETAESGPEAIDLALSTRPDVIFCDVGLPGMSGHEVARALRAEPSMAGTVLVAVTGWGQDEDKAASREAGFDHHLTKPVELAAMESVLSGLPDRA